MARVIIKYLSGSRVNTTEVFPTSHFQSLYIGRDPSCDIRFDLDEDDLVSRSHAMIEWDESAEGSEQTFNVSDLLSSNGTFLNGSRISDAVPLSTGDRVQFGLTGPEIEVTLEQTHSTHKWIDSENLALEDNKQTRVQPAIPDDPAAAKRALEERKIH